MPGQGNSGSACPERYYNDVLGAEKEVRIS